MKSDWKDMPAKRRFILMVLLMIALQALLYLALELPGSLGEVPLGGIAATGLLLASGSAFVRYYRRWRSDQGAEGTMQSHRRRRVRLVLNTAGALALGAYLLLLAFPQPLFPHRISYRGFEVRADQPLGNEVRNLLDRAHSLLLLSPAYDSTVTQTLFLSTSRAKFALFAGASFGAFAVRSPMRGQIFIAEAVPEENLALSHGEQHNRRSLSSVVVHETMHNFLRRLPDGRGLPVWKEEGYAEYIAKESSYSYEEGVRRLREERGDPSNAFKYFKYRMMVTYLFEEKGVSLAEFLHTPYDPTRVQAEVVRWLRSMEEVS